MKKEKFKRVRVLCREDSLRDVLAVLLSGNFKSEVPAAKNVLPCIPYMLAEGPPKSLR